jgi:hypothetical protein
MSKPQRVLKVQMILNIFIIISLMNLIAYTCDDPKKIDDPNNPGTCICGPTYKDDGSGYCTSLDGMCTNGYKDNG